MPISAESEICAGCGMCCDGTLFAHGMLEPGEAEPPGATVAWLEEARCFAQPCPQLGAGGCGIYADRPQACRAFRCGVLEDMASGVISVAEAGDKIAEVKDVVRALGDALGVETGVYAAARALLAQQEEADDPAAFEALHGDTLLKIAAFSAISKAYLVRNAKRNETTEGNDDDGS